MGRRRRDREEEPRPEPHDGSGLGDDDAVDPTEDGEPFEETGREHRPWNTRRKRRPGWAVAREAIDEALAAASPGSQIDIDRVRHFGGGLSRDAWAGAVELRPDPHGLSGDWTALVPNDRLADPSELDERVAREVELLRWLHDRPLPFRVPRVLPPVGAVLVRQWLPGAPLDLRVGRGMSTPWVVVAEVAATIHALAGPEFLDAFATRRAHALASLEAVQRLEDPLALEVFRWAMEHLPPDEPASLLHGDLLGQNVLLHFELPPAVIDWEYARRGDPAYDLAIVTGASRRPFQVARGLERLIEAYAAAGGREVRAEHVRIHELSMLAAGVSEEQAEGRGGETLNRFRNLARRVLAARTDGQP